MKKEFKPLSWIVKNYNCNRNIIEDYNIFKYRQDDIKKLKGQCATKEEFAEKLRREMRCQYWSRAEYELIISMTADNRIILTPWCGCRNPEEVAIDVTDDECFDWKSFATEHINKQIFQKEAKIDIFDQLIFADQFDKLVTYLWTTRLPYERDHEKFHQSSK